MVSRLLVNDKMEAHHTRVDTSMRDMHHLVFSSCVPCWTPHHTNTIHWMTISSYKALVH
jgi:hypothetical protein